jgi:Rrf2 family protein
MLGQTSRYALHILGYLVKRDGELVSGKEIAQATGIPANYLSKVLGQLRKNGFVEGQKGWHGGFRVRRSALRRPIGDVVRVTEGDSASKQGCAFGFPECSGSNPCPLHDSWEQVLGRYAQMLATTRIADLGYSRVAGDGPASLGLRERRA